MQTSDIRKLCEASGPLWPPTSPSEVRPTTLYDEEPVIRRGRKPSLTLELAMAICDGRRFGLSLSAAAAEHGVYPQLAHWWRRRGEELDMREDCDFEQLADQDKIYVLFARGLLKATAACEREMIGYWKEASKGDWRASLKFLERFEPETWAPRTYLVVRVEQLQQALFEAYQRYSPERQKDHHAWNTPELTINMLRQLRELGFMTREQAKITEELEQELQRRGYRLVGSILPEGEEPHYLEGTSRVPDPLERRTRQVEGASRPAAVEDAEPAQGTTAAEQGAAEQERLAQWGRAECAAGRHVSVPGRRNNCCREGCDVVKSVPLPVQEGI